jgi:hypothetical protein
MRAWSRTQAVKPSKIAKKINRDNIFEAIFPREFLSLKNYNPALPLPQ